MTWIITYKMMGILARLEMIHNTRCTGILTDLQACILSLDHTCQHLHQDYECKHQGGMVFTYPRFIYNHGWIHSQGPGCLFTGDMMHMLRQFILMATPNMAAPSLPGVNPQPLSRPHSRHHVVCLHKGDPQIINTRLSMDFPPQQLLQIMQQLHLPREALAFQLG